MDYLVRIYHSYVKENQGKRKLMETSIKKILCRSMWTQTLHILYIIVSYLC